MILLTGTTGLVGQFVAKKLLESGTKFKALRRSTSKIPALLSDPSYNIDWIEADITDTVQLQNALEGVDTIVHSAALISFHKPEADLMWEVNVSGTKNLVDTALENDIKKFIYVSSIAALGRSKTNSDKEETINESSKWEKSDYNSVYAETKYNAELEVWRGLEEGLEVVILNPSTILGPAEWSTGSTQLFKYVFDRGRYYPSGTLNYVDVRDVTEIIFHVISSDISGERFIINGGYCSYPAFFKMVAMRMGKEPPEVRLKSWLTSIAIFFESIKGILFRTKPLITKETAMISSQRVKYDNSKVKAALDFEFRAINETVEWTCRNLSIIYPEINFISNN